MPSRSPAGDGQRCGATALGFVAKWLGTPILACGRAGAHKRLPYGVAALSCGRCQVTRGRLTAGRPVSTE
jgi:hypothetical protein